MEFSNKPVSFSGCLPLEFALEVCETWTSKLVLDSLPPPSPSLLSSHLLSSSAGAKLDPQITSGRHYVARQLRQHELHHEKPFNSSNPSWSTNMDSISCSCSSCSRVQLTLDDLHHKENYEWFAEGTPAPKFPASP